MNINSVFKIGYVYLLLILSLTSCGSSKPSAAAKYDTVKYDTVKYNVVHGLSQYCILQNGLWGDWMQPLFRGVFSMGVEQNIWRVKTQNSLSVLNIYIYRDGRHTSDFEVKISIDKNTGKPSDTSNGWTAYQGTLTSAHKLPVCFPTSESYAGVTLTQNETTTIYKYNYAESCTSVISEGGELRCSFIVDEKMQKAIQSNGLIGVISAFYGDGLGNGFSFK
jgi:hypothetical protein